MKKLITIFIGLVIWSCLDPPEDFEPYNPYDPENPNYIPPAVNVSSGPTEGETITSETATFIWEGNDENMEFQVYFDGILVKDWSETQSYTFDYLDEGGHIFSVQGRYVTQDTSLIVNVNFIVDAVKGPALMFLPRRQIANQGQNFQFEIMAEEVSNLSASEFVLLYEPNVISIDSVRVGKMFKPNKNYILHNDIDNSKGKANILIGLLGGKEPTFTGTGGLATLFITKKTSSETTISFDGSETLRGPSNDLIQISATIGGLITN